MPEAYPAPKRGASLILSFRLRNETVLIVGSGRLAAYRAFASLEADSSVVILAKGGLVAACDELKWRVQQNQLSFIDWDALRCSEELEDDAISMDNYLSAAPRISLAIITDTVATDQRRSISSARKLYAVFRSHNIPVNMSDIPELCDFSFTSTHRFDHHETGGKSSLQIGVTTNGHGCRLASRLRRDIVNKFPRELGAAVEKVAQLRSMAVKIDGSNGEMVDNIDAILEEEVDEEVVEDCGIATPNRPVPPRGIIESSAESRKRRMRWVAQISEYWPISKLASMSTCEMQQVLAGENMPSVSQSTSALETYEQQSRHFGKLVNSGRIFLVGSGPGHPSLLTTATYNALTQQADIVLSDKLVPDPVLALIPKHVQVRIARKFPGNADGAQIEMMEAAVEAARRGMTVVRLKQGDPTVFGRLGEEILFFRSFGFEPIVIPGVSSALAGPTFAGIPLTQRGVASSFIVCTGVGRNGKGVVLPGYSRSRTLVILMGVARLQEIVKCLLDDSPEQTRRYGTAYPAITPIAIIERGSMPDQRVISSTLKDVIRALECSGEQRPPGMMVIGWAVLSLYGEGDVTVLDDSGDEDRVKKWLPAGTGGWRVEEGLPAGWDQFE